MEEHELGPNGAILFCVEYLEANFDWLVDRLDILLGTERGNGYVIFDTPGQVELWTNHDSLKNMIGRLMKMDYRVSSDACKLIIYLPSPACSCPPFRCSLYHGRFQVYLCCASCPSRHDAAGDAACQCAQ